MNFTEKEKQFARLLKEAGLKWEPREGDWFLCTEDFSHQFYLGESLPSSFSFRAGESYVFDSSMTWHIQQGGLNPERFVWLPTWEQCRVFLKQRGFSIQFHDHAPLVQLEARRKDENLTARGETDLEAMYGVLSKIFEAPRAARTGC